MSDTAPDREDEPTQETLAPTAPSEIDDEPTGPTDFAEDESTDVDPHFGIPPFDENPPAR